MSNEDKRNRERATKCQHGRPVRHYCELCNADVKRPGDLAYTSRATVRNIVQPPGRRDPRG